MNVLPEMNHDFIFAQINQGGLVPETYYAGDFIQVQYDQCVSVSRGSSHQLEYEILAPGCVLR